MVGSRPERQVDVLRQHGARALDERLLAVLAFHPFQIPDSLVQIDDSKLMLTVAANAWEKGHRYEYGSPLYSPVPLM